VLFCDLVGSTAIAAQLDPEHWRETVAGYHRAAAEAITRFDGYVVKYLGDGVMAVFGWPAAHDNDAERAVRAGLAILEAIAKLNEQPGLTQLSGRVGIDSGTVVIGKGAGIEIDVFGDAANIAARVEAAAAPGTVAIIEATQRLVAGLFIVEDCGAQELKGVERAIRIYCVIRPSGARGRFDVATAAGGLTPFVGREDELRSLMNRWERAREGDGQVALIIGEAGIGKSRLLRRFREQITGTPHTWVEAGAGEFYQNTPFYPVSEMLRQMLGETPADNQFEQLATRLAAAGLKPAEAIPLIAPLLNLPLPPEYPPSALSPDQQRRRLLATLVEWVLGSARAQPLIVATEDLHWADPSTLELIQLLIEQGADARLLLLYTARPEFHAPWPMRAHHTQINLNRLTSANVRTIVAQVAAKIALSDETVATVVERTGGVPLLVEEVTRAVLESGDARLSGREIPATVHDSLMARLDRLGPAKEIIQIGAVIGSEFSYELIHAVHPIAEADLQAALRRLTDVELLYVRGIAPEAIYQFKHALIRDAAYEALLKSRRKELHLTVARTIDERFPGIKEMHPEILARHWTEAGEIGIAIPYLQLAGERALTRSAMVEAERQYRAALELLNRLPEDARRERVELALQLAYGRALWGTRGWAHSESHLAFTRAQKLAEKLGENRQLITVLHSLVVSASTRGQTRLAQELGERALRLAESSGQRALVCSSHQFLGFQAMFRANFKEAQRHPDLSLGFYNEADFRVGYSDSRTAVSCVLPIVALHLGFPDRARQLAAEALSLAEHMGRPYDLAFVHMNACTLFFFLREPETLRVRADAMRRFADELPFFRGYIDSWTGEALFMQGKVAEGMALVRRGTTFWQSIGFRLTRPRDLRLEAEFCAEEGRLDDALAILDNALSEIDDELVAGT
jgi:class 3 adenylate cyclase/tetratricopeptide (TPR) repeat protein